MSQPAQLIAEKCIGHKLKPTQNEITSRNAIIYALGVGFSRDPMKEDDLQYTYELNDPFKVCPSMATVLHNADIFEGLTTCPGMPKFNPMLLLHGEQRLQVFKPIQADMKLFTEGVLFNVSDKVKGALVDFKTSTYEFENGQKKDLLFEQIFSCFIRGIGGFGFKGDPKNEKAIISTTLPNSKPMLITTEKTEPNQAILYRLSGDYNPLHIDPNMASMGGFDKPILHGLCTYGIACKNVIQNLCGNDPSRIKSFNSRFTGHVFPGETLEFSFWQNKGLITFSAKTLERGKEVIQGDTQISQEATAKL